MKNNVKMTVLAFTLLNLTPIFGATDAQDTLDDLSRDISTKKELTFGQIKYGNLLSNKTIDKLHNEDWSGHWSELQTQVKNYINTMDHAADTSTLSTLDAINVILTNIELAKTSTMYAMVKQNMRDLIAELNGANSQLKQEINKLDQRIDEIKNSLFTRSSTRVPLEKKRSAAKLLQSWNDAMLLIATRLQNEPNIINQ